MECDTNCSPEVVVRMPNVTDPEFFFVITSYNLRGVYWVTLRVKHRFQPSSLSFPYRKGGKCEAARKTNQQGQRPNRLNVFPLRLKSKLAWRKYLTRKRARVGANGRGWFETPPNCFRVSLVVPTPCRFQPSWCSSLVVLSYLTHRFLCPPKIGGVTINSLDLSLSQPRGPFSWRRISLQY